MKKKKNYAYTVFIPVHQRRLISYLNEWLFTIYLILVQSFSWPCKQWMNTCANVSMWCRLRVVLIIYFHSPSSLKQKKMPSWKLGTVAIRREKIIFLRVSPCLFPNFCAGFLFLLHARWNVKIYTCRDCSWSTCDGAKCCTGMKISTGQGTICSSMTGFGMTSFTGVM